YRVELARNLQELAYRIERDKFAFRIVGVPEPLVKHMSKRRKELEHELGALGLESAAAAAAACKNTRKVKDIVPPRSELFRTWQSVAAEFGLGPEDAADLARNSQSFPKDPFRAAFDAALIRLTDERSHFSEKDIQRTVMEEAQGLGIDAR